MKRYNFNSVYSQAHILYGTTVDTTNYEDIALSGWELIGNRETKLYKYTGATENRRLSLPCNVDYIEAVFGRYTDAQTSTMYYSYPDIYNQWVEEYIESWKRNKNVFYDKGVLLKYKQEGDDLVFDRDYPYVTILYHGIVVDDEGLPYLTDKEVAALAAYIAYIDMFKKSLVLKDTTSFQLASTLKAEWQKLCSAARIPVHISQNEMNDVLDVKTRWDRKVYSKSFHPML